MILLRKAAERRYEKEFGQDSWVTFGPSAEPRFDHFGSLEVFQESRFVPRAAVPEARGEAEVVTYVRQGSLAFEDSRGQTGVLRQGEFQRVTAGSSLRYREMNVSPLQEAHVFQIWLRPDQPGLVEGYEQRRFSVAERKGHLCVVASPDGAFGSLKVHQDAVLYSAIFAVGQRVVHLLGRGRGAWLHVVEGAVTLGAEALKSGDGAGISAESAVAISVQAPSEVLLLDLGQTTAISRIVVPGSNGSKQPTRGDNGSEQKF